jgi:hypothetical protein
MFAFLTAITFTRPITLSYASMSFGDDCLSCHKSGITVTTNATQVVQIETNASFWLQVNASGGTPLDTLLLWSEVSHNTHFSFTPNEVKDNSITDKEAESGRIATLYKITAPDLEGNYTVKIYAASSEVRGGVAEVHITVGAGGEIPRTFFEIVMEVLTTFAPIALSSITIIGIVLYIAAWQRIPGGTD